jgi:hypothetical protein
VFENIDAQWEEVRERLNRSIGQLARYANEKNVAFSKKMLEEQEMSFHRASILIHADMRRAKLLFAVHDYQAATARHFAPGSDELVFHTEQECVEQNCLWMRGERYLAGASVMLAVADEQINAGDPIKINHYGYAMRLRPHRQTGGSYGIG